MIKIQPSGDYVQLIYVDPVQESVQQELRSDTDAFEVSYDSDGKLFMQFGAMRFENPDPTDFEVDGSPVTDPPDFISKLNALFTGGGGGSFDIHSLADADTLTGTEEVPLYQSGNKKVTVNDLLPVELQGNREIDLDGHVFQIEQDEQYFIILDPTPGNENASLQAINNTDGTNKVGVGGNTTNTNAIVVVSATFNGESKSASIIGQADVSSGALTYLADTHQFTGINNFANDGAAASGGVPVGGLYHTSGTVKIRLV